LIASSIQLLLSGRVILPSFRRRPDKSAWRVERPEGGPQGERSESSRVFNVLDAGYRIKSGTGTAGMTN
jgi:hypothetical protein